MSNDGAPLVQVVTDLLTDLRHAVEPNDIAKALRLSEMHHTAELSLGVTAMTVSLRPVRHRR
jgi:hypothetical protein